MKKLIPLIVVFLCVSCSKKENVDPVEDENDLVNVSLSGVSFSFIPNEDNEEVAFEDHVNYSETQTLRFQNNDSEGESFQFQLTYEELLNFKSELPEGTYDVSFEVESVPYSEFLPFHFNEENVLISGNNAEIKVNPLTDYSLIRMDTAFLQTSDTIPFIVTKDFGQQDLLLHPKGDHYYNYVTTGNGGVDVEVVFRERTFGEEKKQEAFVKPKNSYLFGLDINDVLAEGPSIERFRKVLRGDKNPFHGYWEYLPAGYGYGKKWPLILFFHGLGQNGIGNEQDLGKLIVQGLPRYIGSNEWPLEGSAVGDEFIVLSMQNRNGCPSPSIIDDFIRWSAKEYEVDIQRIYLTGLSCGGIGIWNYVREHLNDDLVAAVVPIAGFGAGAWNRHGCDLGKLPIWAFHGEEDDVVGAEGTNIPLDGLAGCSNPEPVDARKTIYPGVKHLGWNITYDLTAGHDIYAWMLSHVNENASLD